MSTHSPSLIRDVVFEVLAASMTAQALGSPAAVDQLGEARLSLVGRAAEAVADELAAMLRDPERYTRPSVRFTPEDHRYTKPGEFDEETGKAPPPALTVKRSGGRGLFDG